MPKQHEAKLADPAGFTDGVISTNEGGPGVDFRYGLKADGTRELQAVLFDADRITAEAADAWLKEHGKTPFEFLVANPEAEPPNSEQDRQVPTAENHGENAAEAREGVSGAEPVGDGDDKDCKAGETTAGDLAPLNADQSQVDDETEMVAVLDDGRSIRVAALVALSTARLWIDSTSLSDAIKAFNVDQLRAKNGRFTSAANADSEAAFQASETAETASKGVSKKNDFEGHRRAKALHEQAANAHLRAADAYKSYDSATQPDDESKKDGSGVVRHWGHRRKAYEHLQAATRHDMFSKPGIKYVVQAGNDADRVAIVAVALKTLTDGKDFNVAEAILAMNPNHEPGTGRFAHGSGTGKLRDAGANAASAVAHAATKSAQAFTGSHASAADAHREAAAVNKRVADRSAKEFEGALTRGDTLGAAAHSMEVNTARKNADIHQQLALEHDTQAKAEAEHAIRTGLAGKLPDSGKVPEKRPSLIGKVAFGLARMAGKATVAVAKAPFQLAGWAIGKAEEGRKQRGEQRAKDRADQAAQNAGDAADAIETATGAAKNAPAGLPPPRPRNPDAYTVDPEGNVRRPGALPQGLPSPDRVSSDRHFEETLDAVNRANANSRSAGKTQVRDAEWSFKDRVDTYNRAAWAAGGRLPGLPAPSSGGSTKPKSPLDEVQPPAFDPQRAASANEDALRRLREAAQREREALRKGKIRPYRSWEVPEAAEPVAKVASAILAAQATADPPPIIGAAAATGEFPGILAEADVLIQGAATGQGRRPRFVVRPAYNGGPLQVGAYKLPIIVDLAGMTVNAQSVAANLHHDTTKLVGHADEVQNDGRKLNLSGPISGAGPSAQEFRDSHANGFPWKASIEARPTEKPLLIPAGKSVNVNGREFAGPVLVARKTELYGIAFVPRGADDQTSVSIAARAAQGTITKEYPMELTFAEWLDALGLVEAELKPEQVTTMKAKHQEAMAAIKAASTPEPEPPQPPPPDETGGFNLDEIRAAADSHLEELEIVYAKYEDDELLAKKDLRQIQASAKQEMRTLKATAIAQKWQPQRLAAEYKAARAGVDLALIRASRPTGPTITSSRPAPQVTADILGAAIMEAGKYHLKRYEIDEVTGRERAVSVETIEDVFAEETLDASHKLFRGGIGLQELLLEAAQANGYRGTKFPKQYYGEVLRAAFCQGEYAPIHAAGESTLSLDGILSNYLNKFLLQGFYMVEQVWRQLCSTKPVNDFKTNYSYRMTADSMFLPVGSSGEIKRGSLGDETFTNKADTYAKGFSIPRPVIINDDLNAMIQAPIQIGRGSGLQINDMFWRAFLDAASFWQSSGNAVTYLSGATTNLSMDSLTLAETSFLDMKDSGGNPIGHQPEKLLVPIALGALGAALFNSAEIRDNTTNKGGYPTQNPHTGKYRPVVSRYLSNPNFPGYSSKAWYLLGDPNVISVIEMCFLFGQEAPTIESSQGNFNSLGIDMRGFHDAGVNKQDHRGGVKVKGEA